MKGDLRRREGSSNIDQDHEDDQDPSHKTVGIEHAQAGEST